MSYVNIQQAVDQLKNNDVVAVPTETVYGLAGRLGSEEALKKIFQVKGRPLFDPLIVHVENMRQARQYSKDWPPAISLLVERFWPGPLTVVVPKSELVSGLVTAGLETVGLRSPSHPLAQEVLHRLGEPFAAPSANRFGKTSPTKAEHVESEYHGQVSVLEGGPSEVGLESTVIAWNEGSHQLEVLRPGAIFRDQMKDFLRSKGFSVEVALRPSTSSPGHLENHYEPDIPLVLYKQNLWSQEVCDEISRRWQVKDGSWLRLRLDEDPAVAARELYDQLRTLSRSGSGHGILWLFKNQDRDPAWEAIWDRLKRAAKTIVQGPAD